MAAHASIAWVPQRGTPREERCRARAARLLPLPEARRDAEPPSRHRSISGPAGGQGAGWTAVMRTGLFYCPGAFGDVPGTRWPATVGLGSQGNMAPLEPRGWYLGSVADGGPAEEAPFKRVAWGPTQEPGVSRAGARWRGRAAARATWTRCTVGEGPGADLGSGQGPWGPREAHDSEGQGPERWKREAWAWAEGPRRWGLTRPGGTARVDEAECVEGLRGPRGPL